MRKLCLTVDLVSCLVMLSAAAGAVYAQPKSLTGSAPELPGLRTDR